MTQDKGQDLEQQSPEQQNLEQRLLVLTPTGKDARLAQSMLERAGVNCFRCTTLEGVCSELGRGAAAVLMAEEVIVQGRLSCFETWLARQLPWSDLPVLVLARPGADSASVAQAISIFGNVTVLERPVRVATLVSAVRSALRTRQRQYQMREHLVELDTSAAALRAADKRKDEFLAVLAHELRNPLAPIRMSLEILKRTKNKEIEEEAKAVIERQTNQLVTLVDDLLDVSRISRGRIKLNKERVDLREIIELALESTRPLVEEREHDLQVSLPAKKTLLEVDKTRIAQVLLNLLNNAAKYTEPGGKITLMAELEHHQVVIRVKDTGYGIPEEKLPHIFELFTRLERDVSREGLGIGLSIVKQLVELHGGTIEAYSAGSGQGSEFTLRLPVLEGVEEARAEPPSQVKTVNEEPKARCVLVIDDYEPNRKTIARLVRLMAHKVMTAASGEEGLEALKNFKADLVLLDLNMPGMNGYEVAKRIRENPPQHAFKLVALTGYGQDEDIKRTKEAGFEGHLVKPIAMDRLEQLLAS